MWGSDRATGNAVTHKGDRMIIPFERLWIIVLGIFGDLLSYCKEEDGAVVSILPTPTLQRPFPIVFPACLDHVVMW